MKTQNTQSTRLHMVENFRHHAEPKIPQLSSGTETPSLDKLDQGVIHHAHDVLGNADLQMVFSGDMSDGFSMSVLGDVAGALVGLDLRGQGMDSNQVMMRRLKAHQGGISAVQVALQGGTPLPTPVRERVEAVFGHDFSHVRVHTDGASQIAAKAINALAFTVGSDIVFGGGQWSPGTAQGDRLLVHELTHVVQHDEGRIQSASGEGVTISDPSDALEREAVRNEQRLTGHLKETPETPAQQEDISLLRHEGTVAAEESNRDPSSSVGMGNSDAEDRASDRSTDLSSMMISRFEAGLHQSIEGATLTSGPNPFSSAEADQAYFGNWTRDMNQVMIPKARDSIGLPAAFAMLNYMAVLKFGHPMTPEQFGVYVPAEHMDNPAGQLDSDVVSTNWQGRDQLHTPGVPQRPPGLDTPQQHNAQGQLPANNSLDPQRGTVGGANIFDVDRDGVMAFIRRTNIHVENRLQLATQRGRNPEGLMHFGVALHAVEDLFAHSNWVEIGLSHLLRTQAGLRTQVLGSATASPEVFNFAGTAQARDGVRPILTTGSFTLGDTAMSISAEVTNFLRRPPRPPTSPEEERAERAFLREMILRFSGTMKRDAQLRAAIIQEISRKLQQVRSGVAGATDQSGGLVDRAASGAISALVAPFVDWVLQQDLVFLYDASAAVADGVSRLLEFLGVREIQEAISTAVRSYVWQQYLVPLADQFESATEETSIRETNLREQIQPSDTVAQGGRSSGQIGGLGLDAAHQTALRTQTPAHVLDGPSHSQLAKDHENSVFFGLAAHMTSAAVGLLRDKMVGAWQEGSPGNPGGTFPATSPQNADARNRTRDERLQHGRELLQHGGSHHLQASDFQLEHQNALSRGSLERVAAALDQLASTPTLLQTGWSRVIELLGPVSRPQAQEFMQRLGQSTTSGLQTALDTVAVSQHAVQIRAAAQSIGAATDYDARDAAWQGLRLVKNQLSTTLSVPAAARSLFAGGVLAVVQREVNVVAPIFSRRQRDAVRQHAQTPIQTRDVALPSLTTHPPALRDLLETSRRIIGHPQSTDWWHAPMTAYLTAHAGQIRQEIRLRNAGVGIVRANAGDSTGHTH